MVSKILFEELKPHELEAIINQSGLVYLPLGTLEWHEKHMPFGVDSFISYKLCIAACERTGGCVIPPLYFGTDREHDIDGTIFHGMDSVAKRILPGNIYFLKSDLFYQLLQQIALNVAQQGFKRLVIVSAHSGTAQQQVLEKIEQEELEDLEIITLPGKEFDGGIDHAGNIETSLMMSLYESLVDKSKLKKPYEALRGDDPAQASKEEGDERFKNIVNQIIARVAK